MIPRKRTELSAFATAVALLAIVEVLGQWSTATLVETGAQVAHTQEVLNRLGEFETMLLDAEDARRGFALTGDEGFLATIERVRARAPRIRDSLEHLVEEDAEQVARLKKLSPLLDARFRMLDAAIAGRRAEGFLLPREAASTAAAIDVMRDVRGLITELIAAERSRLEERRQRTSGRVAETALVQAGGTLVAVVMLLIAFVRLRREIAARKASEARAKAGEESISTTLYSIGDGVIATDAAARVANMNRAAEELTGVSMTEALGKRFDSVFRIEHEEPGQEVVDPIAHVLRDGATVELDPAAILVARDGTRRPIADSAAPIKDATGAVTGAVLVFRDMTKTREDDRALHRAHAFLDSIVENIPDMIFVKDARDLSFVRFNRAGEELLGMKREELIGKTDFTFFPVEQARAFVEKDRETLRGKVVIDIPEEPLETSTGTRWLHTKKVPILSATGEPEYLLGISEDITDRRSAEHALREARDAAEAANSELEAFSHSVAHDLRAPLRSIDGFSQALLEDYEGKLDQQGRDYLGRVRRAARRMAELIDDLLELSRVSRAELARDRVDVSALVGSVGGDAKASRAPDASFVVESGITAEADPHLLRIALENLLSNAFKFSSRRSDARVEFGKESENGVTVYFVRDNGVGFDPSHATKLFAPFQRYHRASDFEGTGIGLATVQRIVHRHGGRIWVESTPGQGTTFRFTLEPRLRTRR